LILTHQRLPASQGVDYQHIVFPREAPRRRRAHLLFDGSRVDAARQPTLSQPEFDFCERLFSLAGLALSNYRHAMVRRRLPACLRALRSKSLDEACIRLESRPELATVAINRLLVGVTGFFRDEAVFARLEHLLPTLARSTRPLSVWSAGCSDGAELYSLAMLLAEHKLLAGSYLLGADCRPAAIAAARAGQYDLASIEAVRPDRRTRFFNISSGQATITAELRAAARWRVSSFVKYFEPGEWDIISLRNTAIYLRPEVVRGLWQRIEAGLRPNGLLVVGKAERPLGATRLHQVGPCIYQRARR